MTPQTELGIKVRDKIRLISSVKQCEMARITQVDFEAVPAVLLWYERTDFSDKIVSRGGNIQYNQAFVVSEYPIFGLTVFADNETQAEEIFEEVKDLIGGFMPVLTGRRMQTPLIPIIAAVPFPYEKLQCFGTFLQCKWDVSHGVTFV